MARTTFTWGHEGHDVRLTGSFLAWGSGLPMDRRPDGSFAVTINLPVGTREEYKFIVDGEWTHDPSQPSVRDASGNSNNVIVVSVDGAVAVAAPPPTATAAAEPSVPHPPRAGLSNGRDTPPLAVASSRALGYIGAGVVHEYEEEYGLDVNTERKGSGMGLRSVSVSDLGGLAAARRAPSSRAWGLPGAHHRGTALRGRLTAAAAAPAGVGDISGAPAVAAAARPSEGGSATGEGSVAIDGHASSEPAFSVNTAHPPMSPPRSASYSDLSLRHAHVEAPPPRPERAGEAPSGNVGAAAAAGVAHGAETAPQTTLMDAASELRQSTSRPTSSFYIAPTGARVVSSAVPAAAVPSEAAAGPPSSRGLAASHSAGHVGRATGTVGLAGSTTPTASTVAAVGVPITIPIDVQRMHLPPQSAAVAPGAAGLSSGGGGSSAGGSTSGGKISSAAGGGSGAKIAQSGSSGAGGSAGTPASVGSSGGLRSAGGSAVGSRVTVHQAGLRRDGKLVVALVGLPARGKTFMARLLQRHLTWQGYRTVLVNVGEYRRAFLGAKQPANFFDPDNPEGESARRTMAAMAFDDMAAQLASDVRRMAARAVDVAIFDATNSTRDRRAWLRSSLAAHEARSGVKNQLIFVESVCSDESIIRANIVLTKLRSPDYRNVDEEQAVADFQRRIENYAKVYEGITDAFEGDISYIKLIDVGRQLIANRITGYLNSRIMLFLAGISITPRPIWLTRHGESEYNVQGMIGGDSALSPRGQAYALRLAAFMQQQYPASATDSAGGLTVWTSSLQRTQLTAAPLGREIVVHRALDEIDAGLFDGLTYAEIAERAPEEYAARSRNKFTYRYPRGESYQDIVHRLEPVIVDLMRTKEPVLIVSHQATLRCLYSYLTNQPPEQCPDALIPLHTIIQLTPAAYGCDEVRHELL